VIDPADLSIDLWFHRSSVNLLKYPAEIYLIHPGLGKWMHLTCSSTESGDSFSFCRTSSSE
jgi:hypothetical protein